MKTRLVGILVILLLLNGCGSSQPEPESLRLVTGIQVTASEDGQVWQKRFTDTEKMEAVLHCLRRLKPSEAVDIDPESFRTDSYEIVLSFSDGSETVYRQLHDLYLQKDGQEYQQIRQSVAAELAQLLRTMPGDHGLYS